jgi:hypothetical protein
MDSPRNAAARDSPAWLRWQICVWLCEAGNVPFNPRDKVWRELILSGVPLSGLSRGCGYTPSERVHRSQALQSMEEAGELERVFGPSGRRCTHVVPAALLLEKVDPAAADEPESAARDVIQRAGESMDCLGWQ